MGIDQRTLFRTASKLAADGDAGTALDLLRTPLRDGQLDADGIDKAGRVCASLFGAAKVKPTRVLVLGQCTTTWLVHALTATAWGTGLALEVTDGPYDSVLQTLATLPESARPDVVVLVPWSTRLLARGPGRSAADRVDDELAFWTQAWRLVTDRLAARIVQVGYDAITAGPLGHLLSGRPESDVALVRDVNESLRSKMLPGGVFLDLERVAGEIGRRHFYDPRRYYWTKQPFSENGTVELGRHLAAATRALMTGPKKVLVLDLDNTVWGGVVGETGPLGVKVGDGPDGEAYRAFQKHVKGLAERGVVLTVASKNNDADAREPFEKNTEMVLTLDDIAQFEANWEPKAASLRRMAKSLQLGLDSFVFFDDNPAEREHIRQALPDVTVVDVPEDPAEYVRALDRGLFFEAADLTEEDRARTAQYRSERQRREAEVGFESIDGYLQSLDMIADVRAIDEADLDRVVQLLGKTNQFNLTTRRHGLAKVRQMLGEAGSLGLTLRLADRFGDHGLVAVLLAVPMAETSGVTLFIDTWLMSCRVISRTVEECLLGIVMTEARRRGATALQGLYAPTAKNGLVKDLYDRLGFERCGETADGVTYRLDLVGAGAPTSFIRANEFVGV